MQQFEAHRTMQLLWPHHTVAMLIHMNMSLRQRLWEFVGMPKILWRLLKLIPMQAKENRVHMMAYDVLTNVQVFLRCFMMFFQSLPNFGRLWLVWGLLKYVSIRHQLRDSVWCLHYDIWQKCELTQRRRGMWTWLMGRRRAVQKVPAWGLGKPRRRPSIHRGSSETAKGGLDG